MKILQNSIILIFSLAIAFFFVISSFALQKEAPSHEGTEKNENKISLFRASIIKDENNVNILEKTLVSPSEKNPKFKKSEIGYVEFGRLTSAFLLPNQESIVDFSLLSISGSMITFPKDAQGIISLYDPFSSYRVVSENNDFAIEQMTNGSFYIGREVDGTVSLYSIDAVGRLEFLDAGKPMTNMVLFPGMYIRFDPKLNSTILGADLFRIMLSMVPDGTKSDSTNTTGVEFVNPRMNDTDDKDVFFMYRLPVSTRILFKSLHVLFHDRVARVDLYRDYGNSAYFDSDVDGNMWLFNPSKKNHFLLRDLDSILSDALTPNTSINRETFVQKVESIYKNAQSLSFGNSVQDTLERFLTDGRFALFGGNKINQNFPDIYKAVSEVVGIAPSTAKTRLFEKLSDIYSRNLVTQKKDFAFSKIDTYSPTSLELAKTLESEEIEYKDYFDIALYAFYVLSKTEEQGMIAPEALYATPTYQLISTIFRATDLYVRSIPENERKIVTYKSISLQFYERVLSTFVKSLYTTFLIGQDGQLFLKENFIDRTDGTLKFDASLIAQFNQLETIISGVFENLKIVYADEPNNPTFLRIKESLIQFRAFTVLFRDGEYSKYLLRPYLAVQTNSVFLPQVSMETESITRSSERVDASTSQTGNTTISSSDDTLLKIQQIFPTATPADIVQDTDKYRLSALEYRVNSPRDQVTNNTKIFATFDSSITTVIDFMVLYGDKQIVITLADSSLGSLRMTLQNLGIHVDNIRAIFEQNPGLSGDINIIEATRKIIVGNYTFDF